MKSYKEARAWKRGCVGLIALSCATNVLMGISIETQKERAERAEDSLRVQMGVADRAHVRCLSLEEQVEGLELRLEEAENEKIEDALMARAHRLDDVKVTYYCACEKCCGKAPGDPGYGVTASGRYVAEGVTVAVDPEVIPLGSTVMMDYGDGEIHYYRADDTGSAIKGKRIDVYMEDHQAALEAGVDTATVWWCEEE